MKKAILFISCALMLSNTFAQDKAEKPATVIYPIDFHVTRPLRDIVAEHPLDDHRVYKKEESEDRENRKAQHFVRGVKFGGVYGNDDASIQKFMGDKPGNGTKANWAGQSATGFRPMDPSGAAGLTQYVQMINSTTFRVFNKTTGANMLTSTFGNLWSTPTPNDGDPIVLYDKAADRWFLAQFGQTGNKIYIAVSQTGDATGAYYTWTYTSPLFPDYLKFGVWQDGYYMTSNQSTQRIFVFERTAMLAGSGTARSVTQTFTPPHVSSSFFVPLPGDAADGTLPPTGTPCPIFSYSDNGWGGAYVDAINIYNVTVNWVPTTPTASIASAGSVTTAAFDGSYNASWNDVSQPGTTQMLDGIGGTLMYRAQWKPWNSSGYNSIVLSWGVKISTTQRSVKWCEMRQNQSTGTWTMYQEGIYTPDANTRWMSSIAMDNNGGIALCYLKSNSTNIYPSLCYTGRMSCDPLGTMPITEVIAKAGTGSQTGVNRVGDYAQTTLDPVDGVTFWHTGEYMGNSGVAGTQIYSFTLPTCANTASVIIAQTTGTNPECAGASATFTATPTNGGSLPAYQWQVNGVNVGTNSPTYTTTTLTNGQIVTCIMTSNLAGVVGSPATSNAITMVVNSAATPTVAIALTTGTNPQCSGASVTFTATPTNGGNTPTYQWQVNGVNAGTNSTTFTTTALTTGQIVTCIMTTTVLCPVTSTVNATSNAITMTVNPSVVPAVAIAITSGTNPTCTGGSVTFTATPTNGGTPSYQWKVNGVNAGTNSATFTTTTLTNGQIVTCVMTSTAVCAVPATATSNAITMTVSSALVPAVAIALTTGSNPMCTGASTTFTATPTNGGTTPSYQWLVNGVNAGTNSTTFTTTTLTTGQIVTCVMTSTAACANPLTATSNAITVTVASSFTPSVSIAETIGTNPICSGIATTFTATPNNGGTPTYQWLLSGVNAGTNSPTFTTSALTNGQIVTCVMTSSLSCANPTTATSNAITMTVNPSVTPTITIAITAGTNPKCSGASTTYTATITNGGTATYQWQRNGANVGTNSSVYTTTNNTNNAVITCILTSTAPCASPNPVTSNAITMIVANTLVPSVTIAQTAGTNPMCAGASATFTATPTNGGTLPSYQWKVNGVNAGTNSPTFTTTTLTNGQIVTCVMTSNLTCATPTTATSNAITMVITGSLTPSVAIALTSGTNPECAGASATFTATPTNGGTTPAYQWLVNGVNAGTNSPTFTTTTLTTGQIITCVMTTSITCASVPTATSNAITMVVSPSVTPAVAIALTSGTNPECAGASATFTATPSNGGTPSYQWLVNGANAGTNSSTFASTALTNGQIITCVMTTTAACPSSPTATSNAVTMTVNPSPVAPVANSNSAICAGSTINLSTPVVSGATYAWSGPPAFTSALQNPSIANATTAMSGTYSLTETVAGCTSPAGTVVVTVNAIPSVTNSTTLLAICSGATASIIPASSVANSSFTWTASTTGSITGFTATGSGNINDVLTNNSGVAGSVIYIVTPIGPASTLCQGSPTTFVVTVNPLPTITVNDTTVCAGQPANLTANGATSYTWSAGATSTGMNTATASPNTTTTYTVTGTAGTCSNTAVSTVTVNPSPAVTVNSTTICNGQTVNLIANGATTYTWSAGVTVTGVNSASVTPSVSSTYTVTGTTGVCSASAVSTITVNPIPVITVNSASICEGQTANLVANGGSTYTWSTGATSTGANTATAAPTVTTSYTVSSTVAGCVGSAVSTVTVTAIPPTPTVTQNGNTLTSSAATGNQWYLNGIIIFGATGQSYTATQSGNYSVVVSNNGCASLASTDMPVVVTGISEQILQTLVDVYPNPNFGVFTISVQQDKLFDVKIRVLNVLGQEIVNKTISNTLGGKYEMDLSSKANGIYFVEVKTNGNTIVKKINVLK